MNDAEISELKAQRNQALDLLATANAMNYELKQDMEGLGAELLKAQNELQQSRGELEPS